MRNDYLIEQVLFDSDYQINVDGSIYGRVPKCGPKSKKKVYPLRRLDYLICSGYKVFRYKGKFIKVHRVIYRKFVGKLNSYLEINHKDGVKHNNIPSNLELVTSVQNKIHAINFKLYPLKEKRPNSKLNQIKVIEIFQRLKNGESHRSIAKRFNVHHKVIYSVSKNKTWRQ